MKIVVADKISERGIALLRETGWEVVLPAAAALPSELANADALVVRSATKATAALLEKAPAAGDRPRGRGRGQRGRGSGHAARRAGDEYAGRKRRQRGGAYDRADAGAGARGAAGERLDSGGALGEIRFFGHGDAREDSRPGRTRPRGYRSRAAGSRPRNESDRLRSIRHPGGRARSGSRIPAPRRNAAAVGCGFAAHVAQRLDRENDRRGGHRENEEGRAPDQLRARRID